MVSSYIVHVQFDIYFKDNFGSFSKLTLFHNFFFPLKQFLIGFLTGREAKTCGAMLDTQSQVVAFTAQFDSV